MIEHTLFSLLRQGPTIEGNARIDQLLKDNPELCEKTFANTEFTPLHYAVTHTDFVEPFGMHAVDPGPHYVERVAIILKYERHINHRSKSGKTVMHYLFLLHQGRFAWRVNTLKSIFLLLRSQGADIRAAIHGENVLFSLFRGKVYIKSPERKEMALFLIQKGVPFTGYNRAGEPMLPHALLKELHPLVEDKDTALSIFWEIHH